MALAPVDAVVGQGQMNHPRFRTWNCTGKYRRKDGSWGDCHAILMEVDHSKPTSLRMACPRCGTLNTLAIIPVGQG